MARGLVLLVEDDDALRQVLSLELEQAGYEVRQFSTAEGALCAHAVFPVLAVVDYRLPGMNGLELLAGLRSRYPWLPALIVSSECAESEIPAGPGVPQARLLRKPFAAASFLSHVARLAPWFGPDTYRP